MNLRRKIIITGIIISAIAVFLLLLVTSSYNHNNSEHFIDPSNNMITLPVYLVFILISVFSFPIVVIGLMMKGKHIEEKTECRICPNCGRIIPFDARTFPFCSKE